MGPSFPRTLLLATLPSLATPHFLSNVITAAARDTTQRLLIILFSPLFNKDAISHTHEWDHVQRILTFVYVQATKVAQDMNKILMEVDVLLKGFDVILPDSLGLGSAVVYRVQGDTLPVNLPATVASLDVVHLEATGSRDDPLQDIDSSVQSELPPLYATVALGGTFDHLHAGHKILLSMGAWIAEKKIIVGVTDDALLQKKAYKDLVEPLKTRIERVKDFLDKFRPGIIHDIVGIEDVYGPTGWDGDIQALVVSRETIAGATAIARHRSAIRLPPLKTFIIDVISSDESSIDHDDAEILKQTKMSSTFIRQWLASQQQN